MKLEVVIVVTESIAKLKLLTICVFSRYRFLFLASTASYFIIVLTSFKPFDNKVLPVLTMSQTASAKPIFGAISTEPLILWISDLILFLAKKLERIIGYEVAIFFPSKKLRLVYVSAFGIARESLHLENPSFFVFSIFSFFSKNTFSPMIPISAIPSAIYWGISATRRYNISIGKLVEGATS